MSKITSQPICTVKGCPAPNDPDWHVPWCQQIRGHHCFGSATHAHWPKKSLSGESKIVACLCAGMHDAVDNGIKYGNAVIVDGEGRKVYRLWEVTIEPPGKTLIERVIGGQWKRQKALEQVDAPAAAEIDTESISQGRRTNTGMLEQVTGDLVLPAVQESTISYQERALVIEGTLSWERYEELCATLETMEEAVGFWIGDAIIEGERLFGERAYQPWKAKGYKAERLRQYAWVAQQIPPVTRVTLSWTHHRAVAALPPPQQAEWLQRAQDEGLTTRQLHDCVAVHREPSGCQHEWQCQKCGARR